LFKAKTLKARYLLLTISHVVLLVDASSFGAQKGILPKEGTPGTLPSLLFQSWLPVEKLLLELGASVDSLNKTHALLIKERVAMVEIWE
jgi:hypothetical protein